MNNSELLKLCKTNLYDTDKFVEDSKVAEWTDGKHSYVESVYDQLFERIRTTKNVLEIGIWTGGSHLLWQEYFSEATVVGIDIAYCPALGNQPRIIQIQADAYRKETSDLFKNNLFDLIIDDGPHTFQSMLLAIQNYLPKLSDEGILCIEDIPEYGWMYDLSATVPKELQQCIKVFDLRETDKKYDSLLMVIDKGVMYGKS